MTLHLIHFCLGSNKIDSFTRRFQWEFALRFKIDKKEYYCKRSTNNQGTIEFNGVELKPRALHDKI